MPSEHTKRSACLCFKPPFNIKLRRLFSLFIHTDRHRGKLLRFAGIYRFTDNRAHFQSLRAGKTNRARSFLEIICAQPGNQHGYAGSRFRKMRHRQRARTRKGFLVNHLKGTVTAQRSRSISRIRRPEKKAAGKFISRNNLNFSPFFIDRMNASLWLLIFPSR